MGPDSVKRLEIWRDGIDLVKAVYRVTQAWPKQETYGLTAQVRRSAVSIPANIAEGVGRGSAAEAARFAQIALASVYELDTLLYLASELGMDGNPALRERLSSLSRRISSFITYKQRGR